MTCKKCEERPFFHSFLKVGVTPCGKHIWYSKPSLGEERKFTEESLPNYLSHMDQASPHAWIWIFDSAGLDKLEMPNLLFMRKFYLLLEERYKDSLQKIIILNINWKVSALLKLLRPFLHKEAKARLFICPDKISLVSQNIPMAVVDIVTK